MALPTLTKTWLFNVNHVLTGTGTAALTAGKILRAIKDTLLGFANTPWSVYYSCGGSSITAGTAGDGIDRWGADSHVGWGASKSWIVLKNATVSPNFQVCISCVGTSGETINLVVSKSAGFTGGTTAARPTATDEIILINAGTWGCGNTTDYNYVLHGMMSTDGYCTRIIINDAGKSSLLWLFESPTSVISSWTEPCIAYAPASAVVATDNITNSNLTGNAYAKAKIGTSAVSMYMTCESRNNIALNTLPLFNDIASEFPMYPIGLESETAGNKGRHGRLMDLYFGTVGMPNGTSYPSDGTRQFVQFGSLIFPWNGTVPQIC